MSKIYPRSSKGIKQLRKEAKPGLILYTINEHAMITGQFDARTYNMHICTHFGGLISPDWMFLDYNPKRYKQGDKGRTPSREMVTSSEYCGTTPPPGLRWIEDPADCRDEEGGYRGLRRGQIFGGRLDDAHVRLMERHSRDAQTDWEKRAADRGNKEGWF